METNIDLINPLKLAYIGDTVFDLYTRNYLINKYFDTIDMNELHKKNSALVCAKSQARMVEYLIDNNIISEKEKEIFTHARNLHPHSKSKNSSIVDYRKATGFEAVIGYLYVNNNHNRINEIVNSLNEFFNGV